MTGTTLDRGTEGDQWPCSVSRLPQKNMGSGLARSRKQCLTADELPPLLDTHHGSRHLPTLPAIGRLPNNRSRTSHESRLVVALSRLESDAWSDVVVLPVDPEGGGSGVREDAVGPGAGDHVPVAVGDVAERRARQV